jgi:hypothetical protein
VLNSGSALGELERKILLDRSVRLSLKSVQTSDESKALNIWINIWRRTGAGASLSDVINAAEPWYVLWYNHKLEINSNKI